MTRSNAFIPGEMVKLRKVSSGSKTTLSTALATFGLMQKESDAGLDRTWKRTTIRPEVRVVTGCDRSSEVNAGSRRTWKVCLCVGGLVVSGVLWRKGFRTASARLDEMKVEQGNRGLLHPAWALEAGRRGAGFAGFGNFSGEFPKVYRDNPKSEPLVCRPAKSQRKVSPFS